VTHLWQLADVAFTDIPIALRPGVSARFALRQRKDLNPNEYNPGNLLRVKIIRSYQFIFLYRRLNHERRCSNPGDSHVTSVVRRDDREFAFSSFASYSWPLSISLRRPESPEPCGFNKIRIPRPKLVFQESGLRFSKCIEITFSFGNMPE
jgi:hypothetical protein